MTGKGIDWHFVIEDRKTGDINRFVAYESDPKFPILPEIKLIRILSFDRTDGMKQISNLVAKEQGSQDTFQLFRKPFK